MNDEFIFELAAIFRRAIEKVCDMGGFENDIVFRHFPRACCGDTCYLLAEFLKSKGIETIYVSGDYQGQSHAWLVLRDERVKFCEQCYLQAPKHIIEIFNVYCGKNCNELVDITHYEEVDLLEGVIIDITADQFDETAVYVGNANEFYNKFVFLVAYDFTELGHGRLEILYRKIIDICEV